jgi:hypothetical protein
MWTWVDAFFQWCYVAPSLSIIRDTRFGMPIVQTFHLLGITMLLGMTIVLGVRLIDVGFRRIALDTLVAQLWPWMKWALALIVISGVLVFIVDPLRYVASSPFRFKMLTLGVATLFHFTIFKSWVRRRAAAVPLQLRFLKKSIGASGDVRPWNMLMVASVLTLWFGVGWAGRAIAFL